MMTCAISPSRRLPLAGAILTGLLLAAPARAAGPASQPATQPTSQPTSQPSTQPARPAGSPLELREDGGENDLFRDEKPSGGLAWQMLAAMLVVLVLGGAAVVVSKKLLPRLHGGAARSVAVLETVYLGPRKSLHLVRVGSKRFLLAGTKDQVRLLAEVTGSFDEAYAAALSQDASPEAEEFSV